ncbi:hypothetical protein O181_060791 [Austropuccinia psidii MF-1]|uniref:Uncharacterized protein n=1 Tax=Austropuccinia psidii MF-1 TaxID=1389203 RepID=A0A9Q3ELJ5_9BASI|nr:hypothetical protein [Austropuccinia psidii MF-1]
MDLIHLQDSKMQKPKPAGVRYFDKERFVIDQLIEAQISPELKLKIKEDLIEILFQYRETFASDNAPLGYIEAQEVDVIINVEKPYPQLLRIPAYPAIPRARKALETYINELMLLGVLRNIGHNEEIEVTTPVIITWNNDRSRIVGDFRALNNYNIPDRYLIPRIHETSTQLSKERFINLMDSLTFFHQNLLTPHFRRLLIIIDCFFIYENLRIPSGIKNAPSHYQQMMNTIFLHELSENGDGLSRWEFPNTPDNPAYVPANAEPQIPMEGINITDVGIEFVEEVRESYKKHKNFHLLTSLLEIYCIDTALASSLDDA